MNQFRSEDQSTWGVAELLHNQPYEKEKRWQFWLLRLRQAVGLDFLEMGDSTTLVSASEQVVGSAGEEVLANSWLCP